MFLHSYVYNYVHYDLDLRNKRGIAILVSCDYKDKHDPISGEPRSLPEDDIKCCADTMRNTFDELGYQIYEKYNVKSDDITNLLTDVGEHLKKYDGKTKNDDDSEKVIVFAFSGHGGPAEGEGKEYSDPLQLAMETCDEKDDKTDRFYLKSDVMQSICVEKVADIPKLFFINACRGSNKLYKVPDAEQGNIAVERNCRIEFSTIPGHKAFANKEWMPELARTLLTENKKSVQQVAAIVRKNIDAKERKNKIDTTKRQLSESCDRLVTGPLYLHPMKDRK